MSNVPISPEQRDAQAAAPERNLEAAIALHRALYRADVGWLQKLHQRDGESGLGPPFSPPFEAYLDGRLGAFPWSKALLSLRHTCRVMHRPKHTDRDEWRGSLCHALVGMVIRLEWSLDYARLQLGLADEGRSRRTLDHGLLYIERRLQDMANADEREQKASLPREPVEWTAAPHEHHALGGLHRAECPQCARAA